MYKIYEINVGDTLESIASDLGVSVEVLSALNGLNVSSSLNPNSYIIVPSGNEMFDRYVVRKGDSMYKIANSYGVSPSQLLKLNGLNENDIIYPNQEILVPRGGVSFYVTDEGDTINGLTQTLRVPIGEIARENDTIYLMPDQLIVYKK